MASHSFDDLVEAIAGAVVHARELLEAQHVDTLHRYFTEKDGKLQALTQTIQIPDVHSNEEGAVQEIKFPIFAMVPLNSLKLDAIEVEFDAYISDLDTHSDPTSDGNGHPQTTKWPTKKRRRLQLDVSGNGYLGKKKSNTKISIKLKGTDPPEGLIRINNQILKQIP